LMCEPVAMLVSTRQLWAI